MIINIIYFALGIIVGTIIFLLLKIDGTLYIDTTDEESDHYSFKINTDLDSMKKRKRLIINVKRGKIPRESNNAYNEDI